MTENVTKRHRHPSKNNNVTFNDDDVTSTDLTERHSHPLRQKDAKQRDLQKRHSHPLKDRSISLIDYDDANDTDLTKRNADSSVKKTVTLCPIRDAKQSDKAKSHSHPSKNTGHDLHEKQEWPYVTSKERMLSLQESQWNPLCSEQKKITFHERKVETPTDVTKWHTNPQMNGQNEKKGITTRDLSNHYSVPPSHNQRDITGLQMSVAKLNSSEFQPKRKTSKDSDHSSTRTSKKYPEMAMELSPMHKSTSSDTMSVKEGRVRGEQTLYVTANTFTSFHRPNSFKNINPFFITLFLVIIVAAVIGVTIYITNMLHDKDLSPELANQRTIPVVKAILFIKIVNKKFLNELSEGQRGNRTHPIIPAINDIFLRSEFSKSFYGARILDDEDEDIKTELIFIDTGQITDADVIQRVIENGGRVLAGGNKDILRFGDVVVCLRCFYVKLVFTKIEELPTKPMLESSDDAITSEPSTTKTTTTPSPIISTTALMSTTTSTTTTSTDEPTTRIATTTTKQDVLTTRKINTTTAVPFSITSHTTPVSVVIVNDKSAYYKQRDVIITCQFINIDDWSTVILTHQSNIIADIHSSAGVQSTTNENDRFKVTSTLTSTGGIISINITEVTCLDDGKYECLIRKTDGRTVFTSGRLTVKVLPTRPVLVLPLEVIAGKPIKSPLVCKARVGSAHGTLLLKIRTPDSSNFIQLPVQTQYSVDECVVNGLVKIADFTPSLEANGTVILCEVRNKQFNITQNTTKDICVVDDNICENIINRTLIRHPCYCSRYIVCQREIPSVKVCPDELCFDPTTGICGDANMLIKTSAGSLGKATASISCRLLNFKQWKTITIEKFPHSSGTSILVTISREDRIIWTDRNLEARSLLKLQSSEFETYLMLWIYGLECTDAGRYICRATSGSSTVSAGTTLVITADPRISELTVPVNLVEDRTKRSNVTCSADVGFPPGNLVLTMKLPNMSTFIDVEFDSVDQMTSGCVTRIKGDYYVSGEANINGTIFQCEVRKSLDNSVFVNASSVLYVVRERECVERRGGYIPHPNDCRYFIQCAETDIYISRCSQGLCFNPNTQKCDLLEPTQTATGRIIHPCLSDRHGEYFPHPVLCNKYYWCIQGKEVIQHCRHGTMYLSNGQCTFNIAESYCYNSTKTTR